MPTAPRARPLTSPLARLSAWAGAALGPVVQPVAAVRRWFRRWWQQRLPLTDSLRLTQRNVYILPTRPGLMFAATLVVLLLASINYQLSLGYVLTFLLAGSAVVSMHVTHSTLRGLTLQLRPPKAGFAGVPVVLDVTFANLGAARFGIGLRVESDTAASLVWTDVDAGGQAHTQASFVPERRGLHDLPALTAETRFPLGLFRAWAVWRPAARVLAYPRPEVPPAPLPVSRASSGGVATARRTSDSGEFEGIRAYRRGDSLKMVVWKKSARNLDAGGDLVSRDNSAVAPHELWIEWQHTAGLPVEDRLSRLTAWVVVAEQSGARYGLQLPGIDIAPDAGDAHHRRCLEALALWQ